MSEAHRSSASYRAYTDILQLQLVVRDSVLQRSVKKQQASGNQSARAVH